MCGRKVYHIIFFIIKFMCFTTVNPWEASRKYSDVNATGNNTVKGAWKYAERLLRSHVIKKMPISSLYFKYEAVNCHFFSLNPGVCILLYIRSVET